MPFAGWVLTVFLYSTGEGPPTATTVMAIRRQKA
jgi:hypothetical protein